ncbi:Na(+)-translocating NADH-quinone reductase subunit C [Rubripirellula sp.]|nr:Na(+)-translocating NADH-quinone reductase subunit C [Rubripirellula sp.]
MQQRDSLFNTLLVATVLCVVCSLAVSGAAVALRPRQEANEKLDQQKNILDATGLAIGEYGVQASQLDREQIETLNGWISQKLVDLESGSYTDETNIDLYNMIEAASGSDTSVPIDNSTYNIGEPRRPKIMKVFFVQEPGTDKIKQVVLPVYGKGLWGTLYGYLALRSDLETIQGLTFYQHKETPGLGGEVDNPSWKAQWEGVKLFDESGKPAATVFKGPAPSGDQYSVDGLSGATITSRGVTNLIRYWASDDAYGKYLNKLAQELASTDEGAN